MLGLFFVARLCSPSTRSRIVLVFGSFTVFRESATVFSVRSMPVCSDVLADSFPMRQIVSFCVPLNWFCLLWWWLCAGQRPGTRPAKGT